MFYRNSFTRFRRAAFFVQSFRWVIFGILTLAFAVAGMNALEPLVLKYIFDEIGGDKRVHFLIVALAGLGGLALLREAAAAMTNWLTWRTRLGIHFRILEASVERLQRLPVSYHRDQTVGAIMTRLDRGIQGFLGAVSEIAFNATPALIYLGISLWIMFDLNVSLTIVVLVFAPCPVIITALATPENIRRERTLLDMWTKIYSRFNEVLSGIVTVKSFAMEDEEKRRFLNGVAAANRAVVRGVGIDTGVGAANNLITALARMGAIAAGGYLAIQGEITIGTLVAFLGYLGGLFGPVQGISNILKTVRTASVSLESILSVLDAPDHLKDKPNAKDVKITEGSVRIDRVSFSYGPDQKPILDRINITVKPGEVIALVGPSGTGKSTLMSLIQRLYDPVQGKIMIDGVDLRDFKQDSLRRQIGVVLQDALLFNDSVRNNIAYGHPSASMSEIIRVSKIANAHELILKLPDQYQTILGERGSRLSVGERQRIAIARAILKNPPILILDEATSALDARTEALVQGALENLVRGRTTFIIAHRLSTVISADRILVLKDGHIIEEGKHEKLMSLGGYYASLVVQQTRGLLYAARKAPTELSEVASDDVFNEIDPRLIKIDRLF